MSVIGRNKSVDSDVIQQKVAQVTKRVAIGVDAGSTETRVAIADVKEVDLFSQEVASKDAVEALMTTYTVPSSAVILEGDNREIPPVSQKLRDNYDSSIITYETASKFPPISNVRVLRGRKMTDISGTVIQYFDSSTDKVANMLFYVNVIDGIGYALMQKYNGAIPKCVVVDLSISVRPKELTTPCTDKMKESLIGKFIFRWKKVKIEIQIETLAFTTEPEAQIMGTSLVYSSLIDAGMEDDNGFIQKVSKDLDNGVNYIHVEGGGSSVGVELIKDGNIVGAASSTFSLGGNYLAQIVRDRVREQKDINSSIEAARLAVLNGTLRDGRNNIDVKDIVSTCKNMLAMMIMENIRHNVIDVTPDINLRDIEFISVSGRLFKADRSGYSVADFFEAYLKKLSPDTELIRLTNNYIPQGNLITAIEKNIDRYDDIEDFDRNSDM